MTRSNGDPLAQYFGRGTGGGEGRGGLRVFTPDADRYHPPDPRTSSLMPGSVWGMGGTIIPRARPDGTSRGFDHEAAGIVIVDPERPDSVVIDMAKLQNPQIMQAIRDIQSAGGEVGHGGSDEAEAATFAAVAQLGKLTREATLEEVTPEYLRDGPAAAGPPRPVNAIEQQHQPFPNSYVTPRAGPEGTQQQTSTFSRSTPGPGIDFAQEQHQLAQEFEMQKQAAAAVPQPPAAAYVPQPPIVAYPQPGPYAQPAPYYPPQPQQIVLDANQLAALVAQIQQQMQPQPQPAPAVAPQRLPRRGNRSGPVSAIAPRHPMARPQRPQTHEQDEGDDDPDMTLDEAAEELDPQAVEEDALSPRRAVEASARARRQVDRVATARRTDAQKTTATGSSPPAVQVTIATPAMGTMTAYFHEVVPGDDCLVLVYDTAYQGGQQWSPPTWGQTPVQVSLPREQRTYKVLFAGVRFTLGSREYHVLPLVEPTGPEAEAQQAVRSIMGNGNNDALLAQARSHGFDDDHVVGR